MYLHLVPKDVRDMRAQVSLNVIRTKTVSVFVLARYDVQTSFFLGAIKIPYRR